MILNSEPRRVQLGLGTWGLAGAGNHPGVRYGWAKVEKRIAIRTIQKAFDLGIRFFDTAEFYGCGLAEKLLAEALPKDSDIILASKGGMSIEQNGKAKIVKCFDSSYIEASVNASLRRLKRERIDIYQLHGPPTSVLLDESIWTTLRKLVKEGKIGEFGVAVSGAQVQPNLQEWAGIADLKWLQVPYSLANPQEVMHIENSCFSNPIGTKLIGRSLFHHGTLLNREGLVKQYDDSDFRSSIANVSFIEKNERFWTAIGAKKNEMLLCLGIALTSSKLHTALVGAVNPSQIEQLMEKAIMATRLSDDDRSRIINEALRVFDK